MISPMKWLTLVALLALLYLPACQHSWKKTDTETDTLARYDGWGFTLTLPQGYEVSESVFVDYNLYTIRASQGDKILSIYSGYHPSFPKRVSKGVPVKRSTVGVSPAKSAMCLNADKSVSREVLLQLRSVRETMSESGSGPMYAHCIYVHLSQRNARIADRIISSIRKRQESEK